MKNWRQTRAYRLWRVKVIRRDKVCQLCGSIKHRQSHHLDCASYFPKKRYDIENGICLCKDCHMQFHTNYKRSFRQKCTKYDWDNFMSLVKYIKGFANGF